VKAIITVLLVTAVLMIGRTAVFGSPEGYQQYFRYSDSYPDDVSNNGFVEEANGIAHDDDYWYITNNKYWVAFPYFTQVLWKIPVTQNLYGIGINTPEVSHVRMDQIICPYGGQQVVLGGLGYNHFGDLVAYKRKEDNKYYLLVPIENGIPGPAVAVFRAEDLQCLGFDVLRTNNNDPPSLNNAAGWCATNDEVSSNNPYGYEGYVYTSPDQWSFSEWNGEVKLFKYTLNWGTLGSDPQNPVQLTYVDAIPLMKENGSPLLWNEISGYAQGGEFSPDGKLLYVSSGACGSPCGPGMDEEYGGIHVFDTSTSTWKRIARSHISDNTLFKYNFNSGYWQFQEPEGLTIWDLEEERASYLDPDRAPYIQGQLHVLLLQNGLTGDSLYLYHYTNTTYVDYSYAYGFTPDGTIGRPFKTVGEALAFYNQNEYFDHGHWTGGRIKIHTGSYNEGLTFSRRMQLVPWSGKATVGSQGRFSLTPGGAINIADGGALKLY
jgi:hypothetical protein